MDTHGQRWNLRKFASFSCQLQVNAARVSNFLDAENCEFLQFPPLSMGVHGTLKEYSSLQENPYNVRCIHTVLIIHI